MNKVILVGRLTKDPESRTSQNGMTVSKFKIAVSRSKAGEADFISCVAFNKTAEFIDSYFLKGSWIAIDGHWQTGSYDDSEGKRHYTNDCVVDRAEFAGAKQKESKQEDEYVSVSEDDFGLPF